MENSLAAKLGGPANAKVEPMDYIAAYLDETLQSVVAFRSEPQYRQVIAAMGDLIVGALRQGNKLLICGNGGSAGDAQHIAGEFVCRLMYDRAPLAAIALTTDTSVLTATGNDYGYPHIFERQVQALGTAGDVLLGISTSGTSPNVLHALTAARQRGLATIGFTGARHGPMHELCDLLLRAPSANTAIVQQLHIIAAHIVCALVERQMFPQD
jgi:D-sedoheptulose 7-phosphate isomerase